MFKQIQRIERLHQLLKLKATGSPKECALKLGISERQLYNTIELMKGLGAPIYFDICRGSYCYEQEVEFSFGFSLKPSVEKTNATHRKGGSVNRFISRFFRLLQFYFSDRNYTCYQEAHTAS